MFENRHCGSWHFKKKSLQEAEIVNVVIQPILSFAQGKLLNLRRQTYRCLRESHWQGAEWFRL